MPTITRDTPWRHIGAVPYAIWKKRILDAGGMEEASRYVVWLACGDDSALMLEFLREESSYASDFDAIPASKKNPWNLQTAGVGLAFDSIQEAALAWRARLYDPKYKQGIYERTQTISELVSVYAPKSDGNDTEGYIRGVVAGMNRNGFDVPIDPLPGEEPIVSLPIKQQMIPAGNGNRPGSKLNNAPLWITIHETANTSRGAGAKMHADFVRNGGGSEGVSFHGTVDDKEAYQMLPADEVGYHAGDGCNSRADDIGCFQSFAIETCVNSDSNWAQTKRNLVDFCAAIITGDPRIDFAGRRGQFSVDRIAQHNNWSGKHCPAQIRNEGSWTTLMAQIKARVAEIEGGTTPVPDPPPPTEPDIVPGVDWGIAKRAFDNPALKDYVLTKGGPLSALYLERVKAEGVLPKLMERWAYDDGRVYYVFSNGWAALFNSKDKSIRWIERIS